MSGWMFLGLVCLVWIMIDQAKDEVISKIEEQRDDLRERYDDSDDDECAAWLG